MMLIFRANSSAKCTHWKQTDRTDRTDKTDRTDRTDRMRMTRMIVKQIGRWLIATHF